VSAAVTCVVPVHNGRRYLGQTLRSILGQTHRPLELIVVDNASTDGSGALARSFGDAVTVIEHERRGPAAARNCGIRAASADYVAFCDADDLFLPEKLARQMACFARRPELDICLCTAEYFWETGLEEERRRYTAVGRTRATHDFGTLLARRDVFDRIGLIDEERARGEQLEWFLRAADADLVVEILPEVLALRRMHSESVTHRETSLDPYLDLARERFAARRGRRDSSSTQRAADDPGAGRL
jgi:glycosyltransferase involved in cell wall biosynthesis